MPSAVLVSGSEPQFPVAVGLGSGVLVVAGGALVVDSDDLDGEGIGIRPVGDVVGPWATAPTLTFACGLTITELRVVKASPSYSHLVSHSA
jgi:hypothetical protein